MSCVDDKSGAECHFYMEATNTITCSTLIIMASLHRHISSESVLFSVIYTLFFYLKNDKWFEDYSSQVFKCMTLHGQQVASCTFEYVGALSSLF